MKHISVYVPQKAFMEAITPAYRLFRAANDFAAAAGQGPMFEVEFVGLNKHIKAQEGEYTVHIDKLVSEVEDTDLIVIPALCGTLAESVELNRAAIPWMHRMHNRGSEIASLCLGAFLLGATGLLDGKKCSTHWAYYDEFRTMYPNIEVVDGTIITDEGKIYSSGGANSIWNLLIYLLEKYTDRDMAILAAKFFAIDIDRDNQRAFTIFRGQKGHADNEIRSIQDYIENNYAEKLSILDLADIANVSRRSFERRFKTATNNTINEYVRRVRIEAAKRSFEASRKNVTEVMFDVGYTDTKAFRDVFKKVTGLTPIEYRNKYAKEA
ncbi:GlxA family transcriptional regulator [Dyadobacter luticola]|uniref:Helix-turn-helix domain-containing protein n=1 Tax=Dyadobacter luticola TaxID=1979387 RepID=A0A5R9L4K3_9BACT|nr:helix-turn-helix domain-containing protein [Dyadobacter luticola]TLV03210.1 helix-turn-helix domain-containing protein [Dyadobacter luticola]